MIVKYKIIINNYSITDVTIDSFNFKSICKVEGSIEHMSKAEGRISAMLRQSIEQFLQSTNVSTNTAMAIETNI